MDKQNKYSARPQGFRGTYRPSPAKEKEEAPEKKKAPAKKPVRKPRKKRTQRRKRVNIRRWLLLAVAVLILALIAGLIIRAVVKNANKTVHMLPEIYDIETAAPETNLFADASGQDAVTQDNFIAEVGGE